MITFVIGYKYFRRKLVSSKHGHQPGISQRLKDCINKDYLQCGYRNHKNSFISKMIGDEIEKGLRMKFVRFKVRLSCLV